MSKLLSVLAERLRPGLLILVLLIAVLVPVTLPIQNASATLTPGPVNMSGTFSFVFSESMSISLAGYFSGKGGFDYIIKEGTLSGEGDIFLDSAHGRWTVGGEPCTGGCTGKIHVVGSANQDDNSFKGRFCQVVV